MSSQLQPPHSPNQYRFSREGFQPLTGPQSNNRSPNDATIDIPLEPVMAYDSPGVGRSSTSPLRPGERQQVQFAATHDDQKKGFFGGRRVKKLNSKGEPIGHVGYDGEEDTINKMGLIYKKILNFSIVTRYFVYVSPLALCIAVPIIIGATSAQNAKIDGVRIVWLFTWIEIVWLSLWVSKIVAHWLPFIFQFAAGVVSSGTRKYALVIKALEIPLSLAGWSLASLATFIPLMTRNPTQLALKDTGIKPWESIINKILAAALVTSLVYLAEKLLIQLISINYHRKQFNAKIKDSKHNVYLLTLLYDASRALFPAYCNEFLEEDYTINDSINISKLGSKNRSHRRSGSATPLRLIQDVGRFGDKITSAFGNVAQEITGKQVFNPDSTHSVVVEALEKRRSSEALAKRLWMSFVVEGQEALYEEDFLEVLGQNRREEALECFAALDRDGNGDISLDEMILTITEFGRERKSIASSMHDVDQAINVLDRLLQTVALIVCVFIFVAFLNASFTTTLATAGTALLSMSFVFSVTAQEVLGSCIFLFVKHPYDIGDRVDVGNDQLTVEHISLLFTVFKRVTNGRTVQTPNIVLNTLWIENVSRSKVMKEQLSIFVHFDTSFEDVQALKAEMQNFVIDKENSRDFQPDIDVEVIGIAEMNKLELRVEIRHKSNWANEAVRAARRSKFMCALVLALRKIPIYAPGGGDAVLGSESKPTYAVAVTDADAAKFRDQFAAKKEAKRLFPSKKPDDPEQHKTSGNSSSNDYVKPNAGLSSLTNRATDDLNARHPGIDAARDDTWTSRDEDGSSTLGKSTSPERQDIEEVRGLLHRQSTRGKRRPGATSSHAVAPTVPTIAEPQPPIARTDYAQLAEASLQVEEYEKERMQNVSMAYQPRVQSPVEVRQMARSPSNPYHSNGRDNVSRAPLPSVSENAFAGQGQQQRWRPS